MSSKELIIADFSGGLNLTGGVDKLPEKECLLADACRFDELGNVGSAGATTKQNSVAYSDSGSTLVHSLYINPTIRHLAGVQNDVFAGTALGSLAVHADEAQSGTSKMSFCDYRTRAFYEAGSTGRWIDNAGLGTTVDWAYPATASGTGPNSSGTQSSVVRGSGQTVWTNPANIASSNNVYATSSGATDYLRATNFGFAIAGTPTVLGIKVEYEIAHSGGTAGDIYKFTANLIKAGSPIGNAHSTALTDASSSDTYLTLGSSSDLWDTTWTVAEINAATFGVQIYGYLQSGTGGATYSVDHVRITVYTASGGISAAVGAAGNLTGTYTYKVTFADSEGNESQDSPASASVSPAAQQVSLTSIPTGDTRVTKRVIYRKGNNLSFYYRVGEVSDNATTTFTDDYTDALALDDGILMAGEADGDQPNTRLGASAAVKYPTIYYDRLFWANQTSGYENQLIWSRNGNPFAYPGADTTDLTGNKINVGDAKPITRIIPFLDDLIIFKTDSIWRLQGSDESSFRLFRTPSIVGCDMPFTVVKMQDRIMFTNTSGIWFFDGLTSRPATNRLDLFFLGQTRNGIAPISSATVSLHEACVARDTYYLAYSDDGSANNRVLLMDLRGGTISRRSVDARSIASDPLTQDVYYGDSAGFVKKLDDETSASDSGSAVSWQFQTKYFAPERGSNIMVEGLELDVDSSSQSLTPTIYFDDGTASAALSTVSTAARTRAFLAVPSSTASRKCRNFSLKLVGSLTTVNESNSPAVSLYGLKFFYSRREQRSRTS